jgi:3-methyladenine DNA glycosylase AlkD
MKEATMQSRGVHNLYLKNARFINNWDLVDTSAPQIVGEFLWDKDRASLYRLARSSKFPEPKRRRYLTI